MISSQIWNSLSHSIATCSLGDFPRKVVQFLCKNPLSSTVNQYLTKRGAKLFLAAHSRYPQFSRYHHIKIHTAFIIWSPFRFLNHPKYFPLVRSRRKCHVASGSWSIGTNKVGWFSDPFELRKQPYVSLLDSNADLCFSCNTIVQREPSIP